MVANRVAASALAALLGLANVHGASASPSQSSQTSTQTSQPDPDQQDSSSSKKGHIRHTRIAESNAPPPELTKAEELIQKRDYAGAEPLLQKAVVADSSNYIAWFDLGFTENELGKLQDSISAYRKSVAAKPDVFESNLNLGLQLAKAKQPDAEQYLRAATALKPTSRVAEGQERAWLSIGHLLENLKPDEALAAYRQAAALQPKDAEPHAAAGQLFEKQNKFADAETEYKAAAELDPSSDAVAGLVNIYMRGRNFPAAAEYLRKLVSAHPDNAAAHIELGRVLAAEGKNDEAVTELQAGAKLAPADASVQRDLADVYTATGKHPQAEAIYRALANAHPNDAELHDQLGRTLLRQKKFADAQQEFLQSVKIKPDSGETLGDLAFAASEQGNYVLTLKALDARQKLIPDNANTYFMRASAFDHLKDFKQAAANYHLFLQTANGKYPDQEWQAKHRLIAIEPKKK
jgi:tetratricopeptide (TPR) repeat protein